MSKRNFLLTTTFLDAVRHGVVEGFVVAEPGGGDAGSCARRRLEGGILAG